MYTCVFLEYTCTLSSVYTYFKNVQRIDYIPQNCWSACVVCLWIYVSPCLHFSISPPFLILSLLCFVSLLFILPLNMYSPPYSYSPLLIYSPPFWHLCQRVYTLFKYLSKNLLWSTIICLRETSYFSNVTSMDLSWMVVSAAKWTKPSNVERLGSFFNSVLA